MQNPSYSQGAGAKHLVHRARQGTESERERERERARERERKGAVVKNRQVKEET